MTHLEAILVHPDTVEAIKEARLASQAIYGFTGGDNPRLGRSIWKLTKLLEEIDKYEEVVETGMEI